MHDFQFVDSSLDTNKSNTYHLSIQAGLDGFSFLIFDPYTSQYLALSHIPFTTLGDTRDLPDILEKTIKDLDLLQIDYDSTSCIICGNKSTLLPAGLFSKENIRSYFEFNHQLDDLDELHYNYLRHLDAYLLFSVYHEISNVLIRKFPNLKIYNQASPFIESALLQMTGEEQIALNFQSDFFDIIYVRGQKLILHNNFSYRNPKDVIYFILYVYDKLKLDTATVPIVISGNVQAVSAETETISQFFRKVSFGMANKQNHYSFRFNKIPEHLLVNLFNLYHCE